MRNFYTSTVPINRKNSKVKGYPKLKERILCANLCDRISSMLDITKMELIEKLNGENNKSFSIEEVYLISRLFKIDAQELFF